MEDRSYTFVNKKLHVCYKQITVREFEVLKKTYRKERYLNGGEQYIKQNTFLFCDYYTGNYAADESIEDTRMNTEQIVTNSLFIDEILGALNEREKQVIMMNIMDGYQVDEVAKEIGVSYRQILRYKKNGLQKMKKMLEKLGYESYKETAAAMF